jgi:hypothetical protein
MYYYFILVLEQIHKYFYLVPQLTSASACWLPSHIYPRSQVSKYTLGRDWHIGLTLRLCLKSE